MVVVIVAVRVALAAALAAVVVAAAVVVVAVLAVLAAVDTRLQLTTTRYGDVVTVAAITSVVGDNGTMSMYTQCYHHYQVY